VTVEAGDGAVEEVRTATAGRGADVTLDFVGSDSTLALAAAATRVLGDLTIVGIAGGRLPLSFFSVPYEVSIQTTYWGSRPELAEVLDLAARGLVAPKIVTFPLDRAVDAYRQLAGANLHGRAVITP
jgi:propanol-preferring alcohol dehydrogenase